LPFMYCVFHDVTIFFVFSVCCTHEHEHGQVNTDLKPKTEKRR
jgi:hypothetical protein